MIKITEWEADTAARALLYVIRNIDGEDHLDIKFLVAKLMANSMVKLAEAATVVFDVTGDFPDIYPVLERVHGRSKADEFASAIRSIRERRIATGCTNLPVQFVDENGVAENVVFMTDYEHLRRAA